MQAVVRAQTREATKRLRNVTRTANGFRKTLVGSPNNDNEMEFTSDRGSTNILYIYIFAI